MPSPLELPFTAFWACYPTHVLALGYCLCKKKPQLFYFFWVGGLMPHSAVSDGHLWACIVTYMALNGPEACAGVRATLPRSETRAAALPSRPRPGRQAFALASGSEWVSSKVQIPFSLAAGSDLPLGYMKGSIEHPTGHHCLPAMAGTANVGIASSWAC